jgi:hypothetical protein
MFIYEMDDADRHNYRLKRIMETLEQLHGITINVQAFRTRDEVQSIIEQYTQVKNNLMLNTSFNSYMNSSEYTKAVLICEACRIILKEVHPKRRPKRKHKEQK